MCFDASRRVDAKWSASTGLAHVSPQRHVDRLLSQVPVAWHMAALEASPKCQSE